MVPSLFPSLFNPPPHIRRLLKILRKVEAEYFRKTGIFSIMHSVALRQQNVWDETSVDRAQLVQSIPTRQRKDAYARLKDLSPYKSAWLVPRAVEDSQQILGDDPWPYGLERKIARRWKRWRRTSTSKGLADRKMPVKNVAPNTSIYSW